jgi:hypothetical protein
LRFKEISEERQAYITKEDCLEYLIIDLTSSSLNKGGSDCARALPSENPMISFLTMSSVGFTSQSKDQELEKLREPWRSLNSLLKNLTNAEASLQNYDLSLIDQ